MSNELTNEELRKAIAEAKLNEPISHGMMRKEWIPTLSGGHWHIVRMPNWPEDIAAAWELVEEMRKAEYAPEISIEVYIYCGYEGFKVTVYAANWNGEDSTEMTQLASEEADTAPRAISLAYLAWKEGTK